jgi:hypothetical protein
MGKREGTVQLQKKGREMKITHTHTQKAYMGEGDEYVK